MTQHRKGTKNNPFEAGDRVEVGPWGYKGEVMEVIPPEKPRAAIKYKVKLDKHIPGRGKEAVFSCSQVYEPRVWE